MQLLKADADRGQSGSSIPGTWLVAGILAMAIGLASFAVWFQWTQTKRCLAFFGPDIATAIQTAPRVEAWKLSSTGDAGRVLAVSRVDVSKAPGLVHLRHGLVEDSNYTWSAVGAGRRPTESWDVALAFFAAETSRPTAVLAFDLVAWDPVSVWSWTPMLLGLTSSRYSSPFQLTAAVRMLSVTRRPMPWKTWAKNGSWMSRCARSR
jgi:hypothetical protein